MGELTNTKVKGGDVLYRAEYTGRSLSPISIYTLSILSQTGKTYLVTDGLGGTYRVRKTGNKIYARPTVKEALEKGRREWQERTHPAEFKIMTSIREQFKK